MGERSQHRQSSSRLGVRSSGGEIVEVQGGHIVRSIGRKDRHSKVCTSKGPRDRRVRLAAHTAIQFYDVQDRLGYDRPSKAVDWLITKAKTAIDELAQLPAWIPTTETGFKQDEAQENVEESEEKLEEGQQMHEELGLHKVGLGAANSCGPSNIRAITLLGNEDKHQELHQRSSASNQNPQNLSFLFPSMESGAFADTISSFPVGASSQANSPSIQFQSFQTSNSLSNNCGNNQDLRLSLHSFQDPILLHHNHQSRNPNQHSEQAHSQGQVLLTGIPLGFDGTTGWSEHQHQQAELNRFQRLVAWNAGGDIDSGHGEASAVGTGYLVNSPLVPPPSMLQQLLGQNQFFSQRGPLQSSNTPSFRAWMNPSSISVSTADHSQQQQQYPEVPVYPSSISGIGDTSGIGGFSGFHIPARIQGDIEEHDGYSDKPSSASSDSRH